MWEMSSQKIIGWKVLSMKLLWKCVSNVCLSGHDQVPATMLTEMEQLPAPLHIAAPEGGICLEAFLTSRTTSQNDGGGKNHDFVLDFPHPK